jgi:SAM-dependent methyltransferase
MPGADDALLDRDTDADWRELGASNPYWGVISHPNFLLENLTPERLDEFYASGPFHIDPIVADLARFVGKPPSGRALDFGCGVGRLAEAMTAYADEVVGYDISPGMLALARARKGKATYVDTLPDGPFDWINSFIVFQHIPPERGLEVIGQLLARLAVGGVVSLQLTVWRDRDREWPAETGWRKLFQKQRQRRWARRLPVGQIIMYDYELSQVIRRLNTAGIEEIHLVSTNHDGHHGVIILGRKTAEPNKA